MVKHSRIRGKFGSVEVVVNGQYVNLYIGQLKVIVASSFYADDCLPFVNHERTRLIWLRGVDDAQAACDMTATISRATNRAWFIVEVKRHGRSHGVPLDGTAVDELDPWVAMTELVGM